MSNLLQEVKDMVTIIEEGTRNSKTKVDARIISLEIKRGIYGYHAEIGVSNYDGLPNIYELKPLWDFTEDISEEEKEERLQEIVDLYETMKEGY